MLEEILKLATMDNGLFILIAIVGMIAHALKKYLSGQLSGSITDYMFFNNPKRSALAVLTTLGACVGVILSGGIPAQVGTFLMLAFTTGFTADSTVNKDD